jgi:hypothetical protein
VPLECHQPQARDCARQHHLWLVAICVWRFSFWSFTQVLFDWTNFVILFVAAAAPLNTTVSLEARPVTQQGLEGMRLKTAGPGRQIADKSYFLSELRQKISELSKETKSMTEEVSHSNSTFLSFPSILIVWAFVAISLFLSVNEAAA